MTDRRPAYKECLETAEAHTRYCMKIDQLARGCRQVTADLLLLLPGAAEVASGSQTCIQMLPGDRGPAAAAAWSCERRGAYKMLLEDRRPAHKALGDRRGAYKVLHEDRRPAYKMLPGDRGSAAVAV